MYHLLLKIRDLRNWIWEAVLFAHLPLKYFLHWVLRVCLCCSILSTPAGHLAYCWTYVSCYPFHIRSISSLFTKTSVLLVSTGLYLPSLFTFDFISPSVSLVHRCSFTPCRTRVFLLRYPGQCYFSKYFISPGNHTFPSCLALAVVLLLCYWKVSATKRVTDQHRSPLLAWRDVQMEKGQTLFYYWHNPKSLCLWSQINFLHLILLLQAGLKAKEAWFSPSPPYLPKKYIKK